MPPAARSAVAFDAKINALEKLFTSE